MTRGAGDGTTRRRTFLATCGGTLLAGCAGRGESRAPTAGGEASSDDDAYGNDERGDADDNEPTAGENHDPDPSFAVDGSTWTMAGRDAANTGHNPDAGGPPDAETSRWRRDVEGVYTLTSPAVGEGGVYVASRHSVYAFDPALGERRWTATPVERTAGSEDAYAAPSGLLTHQFSPVVVEGVGGEGVGDEGDDHGGVVVGGAREYEDARGGVEPGVLFGLNAATGEKRWTVESHLTTSPTLADGALFVGETAGDGAAVRRIDPDTGTETWRADLAGPGQEPRVLGAPAVVNGIGDDVGDGTVFAAVLDEDLAGVSRTELVALDAATGDRLGAATFDGGAELPPIVADDRVHVATRDGVVRAFRTDRSDAAVDFEETWNRDTLPDVTNAGAVDGSFAVADGAVYVVADAALHALAAADGAERWTTDLPYDLDVAMAVGSDAVYVAGSVLTAIDPADGERLWERRIGSNGGEFSGPAVAGDALYVAACLKTERADYIYDNDVRAFY